MFDNAKPSDNNYYETEGCWTKAAIRQAMRHDIHVYALLTTRAIADVSALHAFAKQDSRLQGTTWERFDSRWYRSTNDILYLNDMAGDGTRTEEERDNIINMLAEADKEA